MNLLQQFFTSFLQMLTAVLRSGFLIPLLILAIGYGVFLYLYKRSTYYRITRLPYGTVRRDAGRYGEYMTYKYLKKHEDTGARFLFNVYIPKENGETSEIDVLMICAKGIFVFESKNYSGWIFGNESQKNWYQTLPSGKGRSHKEPFYNPIMQNRSHIKHLHAFVGEDIPMHSLIVFSERCTLKNVQVASDDIPVIKRDSVCSAVAAVCAQAPDALSEAAIAALYEKLYPCTQVDDATKAQHVAAIHEAAPTSAAPETDAENGAPASPAEEPPKPAPIQCPKCGSALIRRTASRGANAGNQFYGCANYPRCRYTQPVE